MLRYSAGFTAVGGAIELEARDVLAALDRLEAALDRSSILERSRRILDAAALNALALDPRVSRSRVAPFTGGPLRAAEIGLGPDPSNLIRVMPAKGGNAVGTLKPRP